jgi:hypothetical protein
VFSVRLGPRCYNEENLETFEFLWLRHGGQLGNSEEGELPPLEIVTRKAAKTEIEEASVCVTVIC